MKISILLAHFDTDGSMQKYLDLCLQSLENQTYRDFEVVFVSSGGHIPILPKWMLNHKEHYSIERLHFPAAIKKAYEMSDPKSEYILLLNNDTIMTKYCLEEMVSAVKFMPTLILNPKSNCDDNGRFYISGSPFSKLQYRLDEMVEMFDRVIEYQEQQNFLLIRMPQAHFYCTLMTRKCWEDVGGIDPNYLTGFDDKDFSFRATKKGYVPAIAMHAYALHGSGVSADIHLSKEDRDFNEKYFVEKFK